MNTFSILNRAKYFSSGRFQNYLVFMPAKKCIKYFSGATQVDLWISDGILEENIENITKSESNFAPTFVDHNALPDINFNVPCLVNDIYNTKKKVKLYISYILDA